MKSMLKAAVFGALIATAGLAPMAYAANSATTQVLTLEDDGAGGFNATPFGASFGASFAPVTVGGNPAYSTFNNKFTFSITQSYDASGSLSAPFTVNRANVLSKDLRIDSFDVYSATTGLVVIGGNRTLPTTGAPREEDAWFLPSSTSLGAGSYYLQVTGVVLGAAGGNYSNTFELTPAVTAVPEAETYAMLLAGLGLVGFVGRRKAAKKAA